MPLTFTPFVKAFLTTARIAAFIPGASPPLVNIPIVLISLDIMIPPMQYMTAALIQEEVCLFYALIYIFNHTMIVPFFLQEYNTL